MFEQDAKIQQAISLIEPVVNAGIVFLGDSNDRDDKQTASDLMAAWQLIINQCEIASDARSVVLLLNQINDNDRTLKY